ncbi:hypothetical protein BH09BAC6_BH09BAC6_22790 [soil metagenome]
MNYRRLLFTIICFCLSFTAMGQQVFTIKCVISKRLSTDRVPQAVITNLNSNVIMMSDEIGWFSIKASVGDTLLFTKAEYTPLKVAVVNSSDMPVYMQPVIKLAEVKIKGETKRQELSEIMGAYHSQGTFYNGKPPALSFLTSPLTGIYELFGKTPGRARRFAEFSKGEIEYAEVRRRYNVPLIMRVTKLTDTTAIKKFMEYYTPSFEDLKGWNDYELIKETKKSYDYYEKHPPRPVRDELKPKAP